MVKRIGEREEIKMKALKQREQANRPTQREAEKHCRSLGTRQQEAGRGEPREGQQRKQSARLLPGKVGRKAGRGMGGRESPPLPGRAEEPEPESPSSQAISLLPLPSP